MIIIYDLDRTLLYSPIAMFLDRFRPRNLTLLKLYYKLYPAAYFLDTYLGLLKINTMMAKRIEMYHRYPNVQQIIVSARDDGLATYAQLAHIPNINYIQDVFLIAQAKTKYSKAAFLLDNYYSKTNILMFDDSYLELSVVKRHFENATCIQVDFKGKEEKLLGYVD